MQIVWISVAVMCAAILELATASYGLAVPVLGVAVFYLTFVFGWRAVVIQALMVGALPDIFWGRHFPALPLLILPGIMLLARLWRAEGNPRLLHMQVIPGVACGLLQAAILLPLESFSQETFFWNLLFHNAWIAGQYVVGGALLTPVVCHFFDQMSRKLGLPVYLTAPKLETTHAA